ncbi:hypothetical protein [Mucilaginibacter ginsenosidivorans]|uniref:Uncharacterized protein n=1 Tax=Mucilaginibacter ginsenosidivorans TaxID=398053 RepID=A0A5B8UR12_9SPHI|nr:hypothetical protein [Mucilaginibacter ginsenosidivorans]QEC61547.1 hypothetical protein FRZ54_02750 [Mucilaginibacter ginsenosidivorans]
MNLRKIITPFVSVLFTLFIALSCSSPKPGVYANDQIPAGKRADLHELNTQLFDGLKANDAKSLSLIFSQDMIERHYTLKQVETISNHIKEGAYTLMDEYYLVNKRKGNDTIKVTGRNINDHDLVIDAETPEMYLALFGQKSIPNQWMVSAIYCKLSYGWKVVLMDINPYTKNGKTSPELYELAKDKYAKHYLVDALNLMELSHDCSEPFQGWINPDVAAGNKFYTGLLNEANEKYRLPLVIKQVPTQPKIFEIATQTTPEGVFPMIYYYSKVKLSDAAGIKKENEAVRKVIGTIVPGVDKDKKYIFYSVFNKHPNSYESVDRYEVTDTLK